jgi:RHS repeat-associated protein
LLREYIWLGWDPVAVVQGGAVHFIRTDHIHRPIFATNAAGAVVWQQAYDPFGRVVSGSGSDMRFAGQWFAAESGLHQNWMRDYDATLGRYIVSGGHAPLSFRLRGVAMC